MVMPSSRLTAAAPSRRPLGRGNLDETDASPPTRCLDISGEGQRLGDIGDKDSLLTTGPVALRAAFSGLLVANHRPADGWDA
jgi:hypothetical protein